MKVLSIKGQKGLDVVATLQEGDLKNIELLKKLKALEAELKKAGAEIGEGGMFEIVEVEDVDVLEANRVLNGKEPLAKGLEEYVKQFEVEVAQFKKQIRSKKAKEARLRREAEEKRKAEREAYDAEYSESFQNGYPD